MRRELNANVVLNNIKNARRIAVERVIKICNGQIDIEHKRGYGKCKCANARTQCHLVRILHC